MREGLLDKIRSRAYWRINFRPLGEITPLNMLGCSEAVERGRVSLRGWDYPHISARQDNTSGFGPAGEYYENWVDWQGYIEFWRMYRSTQFLHYRALWEDWDPETEGRRQPPGPVVAVTRALYQITEIFEFAKRLYQHGLYPEGVIIKLSLEGTRGRQLWVSDPMRMPFSYPRITEAVSVGLERRLTKLQLESDSRLASGDAVLEFFDNFGWNPAPEHVKADQDRLFSRVW